MSKLRKEDLLQKTSISHLHTMASPVQLMFHNLRLNTRDVNCRENTCIGATTFPSHMQNLPKAVLVVPLQMLMKTLTELQNSAAMIQTPPDCNSRKMLEIWIVALFLLGTTKGKEVCYERLGCFTDDKPWAGTIQRPLAKLPWSPEKINTRFLLYTKKNPNSVQEITAITPSTIRSSNFDPSKITRFIIHGFLGQGDETWQSEMCRRMFGVEDVNCICVDWSGGSNCEYTQASNNIRVVGAEVAYFIDVLKEQYGYSPSKVHFIAHSLGAHAAGETGRRRSGLGRITGLDPAQPYFEDTPIEVRLDKTDAAFVDIIHTDSAPTVPNLGFGMIQAIGHLDFYPNGGIQMPGCTKNTVSRNVDIDQIGKVTTTNNSETDSMVQMYSGEHILVEGSKNE
ncbi:pancreatic triacylglycerol lipase-like [Pangshura tecta]